MQVYSEQHPAFDGDWHAHPCGQLIYARDGVLTIHTELRLWVVPPRRAVWIVPDTRHKGSAPKAFCLITLYVPPDLAPLPAQCTVFTVDQLLDALLCEAAGFDTTTPLDGSQTRLMQVILDRLSKLEAMRAFVPMPRDLRLVRLVSMIEQNPADSRSLEALSAQSGMTARTAARLFARETGMTFVQWRQQFRLLKAAQSLSLGESVANVSAEVGYSDVSSFIMVFKKAFGITPARYFSA